MTTFYEYTVNTPLGEMTVVSDQSHLHLVDFADSKYIESKIRKITQNADVRTQEATPIACAHEQLQAYFDGTLKEFDLPMHISGTDFQKSVWRALENIPYGDTKSYKQQSESIGSRNASRAVALANSKNLFAIIIPCHRVITSGGHIGGYSGGVERKKWLLMHELRHQ